MFRTICTALVRIFLPVCILAGVSIAIAAPYFSRTTEENLPIVQEGNLRSGTMFVTRDGGNLFGMVQPRMLPNVQFLSKEIALTFDDGPHPVHTPAILDILKKHGVPATFFIIGSRASVQTGTVLRIANEGHQIGNHTWSHANSIKLIPSEIEKSNAMIEAMTGKRPTIFRPPNGAVTPALQAELAYPIIMWSVDTRDWESRDAKIITERTVEQVRPGDIVLLHDLYATTAESLEGIILQLQNNGFQFVTIDQLFAFDVHEGIGIPGEVYYYKDLTSL